MADAALTHYLDVSFMVMVYFIGGLVFQLLKSLSFQLCGLLNVTSTLKHHSNLKIS